MDDPTFAHLEPHIDRFVERLSEYERSGNRIIASSSFQTQSMPLLHLLAQRAPGIPVYFVDTGFHFAETLAFRDHVRDRFDLDVTSVGSPVSLAAQRTTSGLFLWAESTDRCCRLNKTVPLEPVLAAADVWITGVRRDQSATRAGFEFEAPGPHGVTRMHPMLEWTKQDIWRWITAHDLPRHPLELQGYDSIGCAPCTAKPSLGDDRGGRWGGMRKTECGLHTTLAAAAT